MSKSIIKNYDQTDNKLKNNFEDTKYLIGLLNRVMEQIKMIHERIDRMQTNLNSVYGD